MQSGQNDAAVQRVSSSSMHAYFRPAFTVRTNPLYPCSVTEMEEYLWQARNTFAYQKDGPITELFNHRIGQLAANGVVKKLWRR